MTTTRDYVRVDHASILETCKKNLQNLSYLDRKNDRHDRFLILEHALFVKQNYLCPHFDEVKGASGLRSQTYGQKQAYDLFLFQAFSFQKPRFRTRSRRNFKKIY